MHEPRPGSLRPATAYRLNDLVTYAEGSVVSRTIVQEKAATLTLFAFDEGQALSEHTTAFDAYLEVLDGEADLVIGGTAVNAAAGAVVLLPASVPHAVHATRRFKMLLTMVRP